MTGGLINIVSYGATDLYLVGDPQITFFKVVYRRHTNFAKECITLGINSLNFNEEIKVEIPKVGDLVGEMYLQLNIPSVSFTRDEIGIEQPTPTYDPTNENNYKTITDFIKLNSTAFRTAYNDYKAINLAINTMIDDINTVFSSFTAQPTLITEYGALLSNDKSSTGFYWLDPNLSDISKILSQLDPSVGGPTDPYPLVPYGKYTKDEILFKTQNAINICVKVQEYYYNKLLDYNNSYNEEVLTTAKFAWVKKLGHSIIEYISVSIGGEEIDKHYGDWFDIWHELTDSYYQKQMYDKLIGNVSNLTTFDRNTKPNYTMMIPLMFWFNRRVGQSFPLVALKYHNLYINIKLRPIENCMYIEKNTSIDATEISLQDLWDSKGYSLGSSLLVNYVYLDEIERKRFAQSAHEYLIERVQRLEINDLSDPQINILLDSFFSPCKEIIWYARKNSYIDNYTNYFKSLWNNYGLDGAGKGNPIINAEIVFNGYTRTQKNKGAYYNYVKPYTHHSNSIYDGINIYSFSLFPEEYQPSSSCNFTRIANAQLNLNLDNRVFQYRLSDIDPSVVAGSLTDSLNETTISIVIYMVSHNVLRIVSGMGSLAYQ